MILGMKSHSAQLAQIHDVTINSSTDTAQRGTTDGIISGDSERGKKDTMMRLTKNLLMGIVMRFSDGNHILHASHLCKQQEITINVR